MEDLRRAGWEVSAGDARGETGDARGDTGDARGDTGDTGGDAGGAGGGTGDPSGDARRDGVNLCVVNSCAVTARAEGKSRQLTRRLRRQHPGAIVALVGCYPELRRAEAAAAAGADVVLGTGDRDRLAGLLRERGLPAAGPEAAAAAPVLPGAFAGERTRAVVKVQDGCEQRCTYCVIPYVRGPSRSRPPEEVAREVGRLVEAGFKEVVLTGIHLGAWGLDLEPPGRSLSDLVREVLDVPGLARLRLSSIEPLEVTGALVDLMASDRRVCRHLHLPLQSGSDAVLEKMNRPYTAGEYLAVVERVRARVPLLGLTTDVMVGFPGETDEDFERTLEVVRRARFSRLHVFRFSRRPGTPAADLPGQVPTPVKKARSEELIRLGRHLGRDFRESLIGRTLEVLVERLVAPGEGEGLTDNYVRVRFRGPRARPNEIVPVLLEEAGPDGLVGREVSPSLPRGGRPR
jgi:threonylcarbamoyladenosine tRNA methylthiotransferase MtaB